jgi:hypothetical protein
MTKHALFMLSLAAMASSAWATTPCDQKLTRGSWMYTCEGTLPGPAGPTATRMLGTCSASRSAYWTCSGTVNLGGAILPQELVGQATNHPNCTGTISYAHTLGGQSAGVLEINYVIFRSGNAISGLPVNSGGVLSCSLRRIGNAND